MNRISPTLVTIVLVLALANPAIGADLGLITGSDKGTYYQFGLNLQALVKPNGMDLAVYTSQGSIENIYAVYQKPGVQMGIVQSDVLAFVSRVQSDPVLKRVASKTKMVFPLYNEEIHLLGRRDIASFDDLADKRVAIGREGSGTFLTTRLLFKVSEVLPKEMVPIDTDEALAELKAGRIDAMFYVAGYPVKLLSEKVTAEDGLALIPITSTAHTAMTGFRLVSIVASGPSSTKSAPPARERDAACMTVSWLTSLYAKTTSSIASRARSSSSSASGTIGIPPG